MPCNSISTFFVVIVLLHASVNPVARAFFFNRKTILTVTGRVCCTATGTCAAGSIGIATAPATLNCPRGVVAATITDAAGNFIFTANIPRSTSPSLCRVNIAFPLVGTAAASCPLLAVGGGTLVGPVVETSSGVTGGFFFNVFGGTKNVMGTVIVFVRNQLV